MYHKNVSCKVPCGGGRRKCISISFILSCPLLSRTLYFPPFHNFTILSAQDLLGRELNVHQHALHSGWRMWRVNLEFHYISLSLEHTQHYMYITRAGGNCRESALFVFIPPDKLHSKYGESLTLSLVTFQPTPYFTISTPHPPTTHHQFHNHLFSHFITPQDQGKNVS